MQNLSSPPDKQLRKALACGGGRIASKMRCGWGLSPHGECPDAETPSPQPSPASGRGSAVSRSAWLQGSHALRVVLLGWCHPSAAPFTIGKQVDANDSG
jgi:hypothetical protein